MGKEHNSKISLRSIHDILGESFFIPSYQRGYRWNEIQVEELLNDIWLFKKESDKVASKDIFYCLQPIVVCKNNEAWEVVDGQQRLTTIYLILRYLKKYSLDVYEKENFNISYDTRKDSRKFLIDIDFNKENENIDYSHICRAYNTIDRWFNKHDSMIKHHFFIPLLNSDEFGKNVKVIWYDITGEDIHPIDVFTRINIGKIPLTNSELIKAKFLGEFKPTDKDDKDRVYLERIKVSNEWDKIEYSLQNNEFWYFFSDGYKQYDTRIEYIFDIMIGKSKEHEKHFTFHKFHNDLETKDIKTVWNEIKSFYYTIEDWYHDRELYHYIGYLITVGKDISDIINDYNNSETKTKFKEQLIFKIKGLLPKIDDIETLEYDRDKKKIKEVLLLFNILTLLSNTKSKNRFPFDFFKQESWDAEHVHSIKSNVEEYSNADKKKWLEIILKYFTGVDVENNDKQQKEEIEKLDNKDRNIAENIYNVLFSPNEKRSASYDEVCSKVLRHFKEDSQITEINSISNIALLDSSTNRSYKNAPFPVKRKILIEKDMNGSFIPVCTRNVFLKAYSRKFDNVMYWQDNDSEDYLKEIKKIFERYFK